MYKDNGYSWSLKILIPQLKTLYKKNGVCMQDSYWSAWPKKKLQWFLHLLSVASVNIGLVWILSSELPTMTRSRNTLIWRLTYYINAWYHTYFHCSAAVKMDVWNALDKLAATRWDVGQGVEKNLQKYHKLGKNGKAKATLVHTLSQSKPTKTHVALLTNTKPISQNKII